MSIELRLKHEDGVRLRQQTAHVVERVSGNLVTSGKDWKFDRYQDSNGRELGEIQQDTDTRRVGPDGKHMALGTYTVHVTAGMHNLVVERKGKIRSFDFQNRAIRNQIRIKYQKLVPTDRKKGGQVVHEWVDDGIPQYIAPNTFGGVFVGDGQRAIIDEMPT